MNDFTIEELHLIDEALHYAKDSPCWSFDRKLTEPLEAKIQSMIENYSECNHKEIVTGAYPRSNPPKKCDICRVLYR
jgi:hypothetical protein